MLQQIKQLLAAEKWPIRKPGGLEHGWWKKIERGSRLHFGPMVQSELSESELAVGDVVLYDFGQLQFLSYVMRNEKADVASFIIAGNDTPSPYLAISRKLSSRDIENLFADEDAKRLKVPGGIRNLYVRDHVPGLKEWVTMNYSIRIEGIRGKKNDKGTDRVFEYALYVNSTNDKGIEIEYFLDGHAEIYATIYRPISDVLSVDMAPPATMTRVEPLIKFEKSAPSSHGPAIMGNADQAPPPLPVTKPAPVKAPAAPKAIAVEAPATALKPEVTKAPAKRLPEPTAPVTPVHEELLGVDMLTAARIITEAMSSNQRVGEVLRQALGLPAIMDDKISFHLPLTDEDYRALSERYRLDKNDRASIRHRMSEELIRFNKQQQKKRA